MWLGMSHSQPGYVLSRQVPPTSSAFSSTTKSLRPDFLSFIAIPIPEKPVPMMTISLLITFQILKVSGIVAKVTDTNL